MLNRVILIGYVGSDAEVRVLETGAKMASFRLATNESYVRGDGTTGVHVEWHSVVAWREVAATAERIALRGAELYVEGSIRSRTAVDPKTKQEQVCYQIVAQVVRPANDALVERGAAEGGDRTEPTQASFASIEDPDGLPF